MKEYKAILFSEENNVATITINQPESMNALTAEILTEIGTALDVVEADESIKVLVITGSGEKAFVAGANIKGFTEMDIESGTEFSRLGNEVFYKLSTLRQPTIAAGTLAEGCRCRRNPGPRERSWPASYQRRTCP